MKFQTMKAEYQARYADESEDPEIQALFGLFDKAEKMSAAAQAEFVKAFDYNMALDGQLPLGGDRTANARFPHLLQEAPAVGIELVIG